MKLALIGTGKIIEDALFAMEPVKTIERTAVFARPHSRDEAEKLAKQYAIKEVYTDYEELLKKTEADTVYIGLVNSAHYPYAKQALLAGKNVILEKPFTGFYEETKELAQIANSQRRESSQLLISPNQEQEEKNYYLQKTREKLSQHSIKNYLEIAPKNLWNRCLIYSREPRTTKSLSH